MGILSRSVGIQNFSLEDPAQALIPPSALFESMGLGSSDAGVLVNERQALRLSTVYSCIKGISEDLSSTSFEVIQEMPDQSMSVARNHRLWPILHDEWNPNMSSMVGRSAIIASSLGWGNGYAWIKRDRAARVISLHPLDSGKTSPVRVNGELMYATTQTDSGLPVRIDPENVLHVMGLSQDGILGLSPIGLCKNAIGLGLAAEKFGAQFFGNGARSSGVLTHPGALEEEAYNNLKKSVREWATGESAQRPIILEEGMTWQQMSINPNDGQFLETRKFQREDIAGMFRFPLHLLGSLERATNNNIEHQGLDYVRYCLRPWAIRLEHEVNRKLLSGKFTSEHNLNDLQRGDFASQTAGFQTLRNIGVYSSNDILRQLRQNPIPVAEGGDVRTIQGAMIPLTALLAVEGDAAAADAAQTNSDQGGPAAKHHLVIAYRRLFRDAVGRVVNRESRDEVFIRRAFQPLVASMAEAMFAQRFGNGKLTPREDSLISNIVQMIIQAAASWTKGGANETASEWTDKTYGALAGEIL